MYTMTNDLRQLLVDAAAALENLTDLDAYGDGSGEYRPEQAEGVRLAGLLRDAAAGRPAKAPRIIAVEQTTDDGYEPVEVCEFRLPGDGTVELVTSDGYERLAFPESVAADIEELARLVCEEVADGDDAIYDPDKPVILTER